MCYCGPSCQRAHWKLHKASCEFTPFHLPNLSPECDYDAALFVANQTSVELVKALAADLFPGEATGEIFGIEMSPNSVRGGLSTIPRGHLAYNVLQEVFKRFAEVRLRSDSTQQDYLRITREFETDLIVGLMSGTFPALFQKWTTETARDADWGIKVYSQEMVRRGFAPNSVNPGCMPHLQMLSRFRDKAKWNEEQMRLHGKPTRLTPWELRPIELL
jgi:hypothetical protein